MCRPAQNGRRQKKNREEMSIEHNLQMTTFLANEKQSPQPRGVEVEEGEGRSDAGDGVHSPREMGVAPSQL